MRIERLPCDTDEQSALCEQCSEVLEFGYGDRSVCILDCPKAAATACSRNCPDIPHFLSSDPERHPLEKRIAPLAFELKRLGVFQPCWSCEGHNHRDGTYWKPPRIWFYSHSVVHLRMLADGLKELHLKNRLSGPWQVVATHTEEDSIDTAFSLEPDLTQSDTTLAAQQDDIDTIAAHIGDLVHSEARKLLRLFD